MPAAPRVRSPAQDPDSCSGMRRAAATLPQRPRRYARTVRTRLRPRRGAPGTAGRASRSGPAGSATALSARAASTASSRRPARSADMTAEIRCERDRDSRRLRPAPCAVRCRRRPMAARRWVARRWAAPRWAVGRWPAARTSSSGSTSCAARSSCAGSAAATTRRRSTGSSRTCSARMSGRGPMPVTETSWTRSSSDLVPGGYFEAEVDAGPRARSKRHPPRRPLSSTQGPLPVGAGPDVRRPASAGRSAAGRCGAARCRR